MENKDFYLDIIAILLPLSAFILVIQVNPYHALVIRGILGATSTLIYAVLGAADVALTEALMGTMLTVALYAITVRSSMVMRLGVLQSLSEENLETNSHFNQFTNHLEQIVRKYHLHLEVVSYQDTETLQQALLDKEIHGTCVKSDSPEDISPYNTIIRVRRIYEILKAQYSQEKTILTYINPNQDKEERA